MAELAASVLTIAQVACVLFEGARNAIAYLEEVQAINNPINDLLDKAKDLERLTKTVASTYKRAEPFVSSDSRSLRQIRKELVACEERLKKLKLLAFDLASLKSTTWREKLTIKRRIDRLGGSIKTLKQGIQNNINMLQLGLTCLIADLNTNPRASESVRVPEANPTPFLSSNTNEEAVSPISSMSRALSDADTVFGPDPDLQLWGFPTSQFLSPRPSTSSTSSHTPSRTNIRADSVTSATELTPLSAKNEWKDLEFHIIKSRGNQEQIREILQRHSDGAALARSKDMCDRTPLHAAAQRGDIDLARILINDYHADINAQDSKPYSVLDLAVMGKHREFVALLIEQGVNEQAILEDNKRRFREIKGVIAHEKRVAGKTRAMSRSEQSGAVT
jgi:hypothetical protein